MEVRQFFFEFLQVRSQDVIWRNELYLLKYVPGLMVGDIEKMSREKMDFWLKEILEILKAEQKERQDIYSAMGFKVK